MKRSATYQRAPRSPDLPATPFRFVLYFVARYRWWYLTMLAFETANAACGILIPYALSRIIKTVSAADGHSMAMVDALQGPLMLFVAFCVGELVFGRLAGGVQIRLGPRQRQNVTRQLYHYLQQHSHRYFSNNFAGSLAHRISETSMGVVQILWSIITEFWPITITLSLTVILLYRADPMLGYFSFAWAAGFVLVSFWLAKRCQPYAHKAAAAPSETTRAVRDLSLAGIRRRHPNASEHECFLRLAAILLGVDTARRVYPDAARLVDLRGPW